MKILFVCHRLITFILNEIIELEKMGNDVSILSVHRDTEIYHKIVLPILKANDLTERTYIDFTPRGSHLQLLLDTIHHIVPDAIQHPLRTIRSMVLLRRLFNTLRDGIGCYIETRPLLDKPFDVIHSPFSTPDNIKRTYYLSKMLRVPYTLSFRAHDIYEGFNISLKAKELILSASNIFLSSRLYEPLIVNKLEYDKRIDIIHGSVDTDFFKPDGSEKAMNRIISVCRFHAVKGIIHLLHACLILRERKIPFECHLIGQGPEEQSYRDFIRIHQLRNVIIHDFLSRDGVRDALSKSEVFVLPCVVLRDGTHDILPNSIKEAMSMELPVITSDICGIRELVDHRENGILIPPESPDAIANSIEQLFSDKHMSKNMGENARKKILADFNIKSEAEKLLAIFSSTAPKKGKG